MIPLLLVALLSLARADDLSEPNASSVNRILGANPVTGQPTYFLDLASDGSAACRVISSALPLGAATAARQDTGNASLASIVSSLPPGVAGVQAYADLTASGVPSDGDTFTVTAGSHVEVITFRTSPSQPNDVLIGPSAPADTVTLLGVRFTTAELVATLQSPVVIRVTAGSSFPGTSGNTGIRLQETSGVLAVSHDNGSGYATGGVDASYSTLAKASSQTDGTQKTQVVDAFGNVVTSQASGSQRALDVGITISGVQVDPRQIRALSAVTDFVGSSQVGTWTVQQGSPPWAQNLSQYGGSSVGAGNALHVQPGTGATFTVTGTVTANIGTPGDLALDATLGVTNTRIGGLTETAPGTDTGSSGLNGRLQRIAQRLTSLITEVTIRLGTLGQNLKSGSTPVTIASDQDYPFAAVNNLTNPAQAVSLGADDTANIRRLQGRVAAPERNVYGLAVRPLPFTPATFHAGASAVAIGNGKSMLSLENAAGSPVIVRVHEIKLINVQTAAVAGVVAEFQARRFTSHAAGTLLTVYGRDTADAIDGSVTARTGATITADSGVNNFGRRLWSSDEWGPGAADTESGDHGLQSMGPQWEFKHGEEVILRAGEGLHIRQNTNSTAGTFDLEIVFTQEAA